MSVRQRIVTLYLSVDYLKFSFSVEGQDFTIMPPDVFEVTFPPGTVNGTTMCDPCLIINDDTLEGALH